MPLPADFDDAAHRSPLSSPEGMERQPAPSRRGIRRFRNEFLALQFLGRGR